MHDSCILHPQPPLLQGLGWQCPLGMLYGVYPDISIILLYTFYKPVFYATHNQSYPSVSEKGQHNGLALETMLVMLSPTNVLLMTPRKSSTDLLLDLQILPIPTRDWYQMEGRAPRPPNPLSLSGLGKMIVNLLPNPWQNITMMTLLGGPSYSQRMNKEKDLGPL